MRQSQLFAKTSRHDPKDETAVNAKLLLRAGFVHKNSAGIYSYLPLGWRVLKKIEGIIREKMNAIGGQEIFMPALLEKRYLEATGRWDVEIGFEARGKKEKEAGFVMGWTHEEVITEIAAKNINSYKDLPFSAYQIQTKFRNEPRAKSGLLRGREFIMKDLYSFHVSEDDLARYYKDVRRAYEKIFKRCGLESIYTRAAGGDFTASETHEFQVISPAGEDTIYICEECGYAENKEVSKLRAEDKCPKCPGKVREEGAIEVGNIFPLGTKYSEALNLTFVDERGEKRYAVMGSYGIGLGRTMGAIVEIHHDEKGIIWPESVAPFHAHLIELPGGDGESIYKKLTAKGVDVLYDDRKLSAGEKFAEADLLGIPVRLVVSEKTKGKVEVKKRGEGKADLMSVVEVVGSFR